MAEEKKAEAKQVAVKLNQAHTHKRKPHKANETIHVAPHTAEYLVKQKIGERA